MSSFANGMASLNMYVSFFLVKHSPLEKVFHFPFNRDQMSSVYFLLSLRGSYLEKIQLKKNHCQNVVKSFILQVIW